MEMIHTCLGQFRSQICFKARKKDSIFQNFKNSSLKKDFMHLFLERGKGGQTTGRERNIDVREKHQARNRAGGLCFVS